MSKAEILDELPNLEAEERAQVFRRLCELAEDDLLHGVGPTDDEKQLLDEALAHFRSDGYAGKPWREAIGDIQASGTA